MAEIQECFERVEKKYLLDTSQYAALSAFLRDRMDADPYGNYTVSNLYYDTADYEIIRDSLGKPLYKEKLRLRSYAIPGPDDMVFLELKKKFNGIVYKRRTPMTLSEAERYLQDGALPERPGQILKEIDWFCQRRQHPQAKVFIAYDRIALHGRDNDGLRVTFDRNIRWRESMLRLSSGHWGTPLIPGKVLMEIKIPGVMPVWLSGALSEWGVYPTTFSKYGACYVRHLVHGTAPEGVNPCA